MQKEVKDLVASVKALTTALAESNRNAATTNDKLNKLCDVLAGLKETVDQQGKEIVKLKSTIEEQGMELLSVNKFLAQMIAVQFDVTERSDYQMEKDTIQSVIVTKVKNSYNMEDITDFLAENKVVERGTKPHGFQFTNENIPGFVFYRITLANPQQATAAYKLRQEFTTRFGGWLQRETTKAGAYRRRIQGKFSKVFNERAPKKCQLKYSYILINGHNIGHVRFIPENEAKWPDLIRELLTLTQLKRQNPEEGKRVDIKSVQPGPQAVLYKHFRKSIAGL